MEFQIPDENINELKDNVQRLQRRAGKLGALGEGEIFFCIGDPVDTTNDDGEVFRHWPVTIEGKAPKYKGWSFVAKIENGAFYGDGVGDMLKSKPGETVPDQYRPPDVDATACDHCNASRKRKDTFVIKHDDGDYRQVGRQCLKDFLGHKDPEKLAKLAEVIWELFADAEAACGGGGGGQIEAWDKRVFLAYVSMVVRQDGRFVGRARAEEWETIASVDSVLHILTPGGTTEKPKPHDKDYETADAMMSFSRTWLDGMDSDKHSDYTLNLRTALDTDTVSYRSAGIVASLAACYRREMEQQAERQHEAAVSEHVGEVKKREEFVLTLVRQTGWETEWGYTTFLKFRDQAGNVMVWKSSSEPDVEVGLIYDVKATVKEHSEYEGVKQTILTRCKINGEHEAAA